MRTNKPNTLLKTIPLTRLWEYCSVFAGEPSCRNPRMRMLPPEIKKIHSWNRAAFTSRRFAPSLHVRLFYPPKGGKGSRQALENTVRESLRRKEMPLDAKHSSARSEISAATQRRVCSACRAHPSPRAVEFCLDYMRYAKGVWDWGRRWWWWQGWVDGERVAVAVTTCNNGKSRHDVEVMMTENRGDDEL